MLFGLLLLKEKGQVIQFPKPGTVPHLRLLLEIGISKDFVAMRSRLTVLCDEDSRCVRLHPKTRPVGRLSKCFTHLQCMRTARTA